jgi:hypothetical protein
MRLGQCREDGEIMNCLGVDGGGADIDLRR